MRLPNHQTTLDECNLNWPKELEIDSWQNESSHCGALIHNAAIKNKIVEARYTRRQIRWSEYPILFATQNSRGLDSFYRNNVKGLVDCLGDVEAMAGRQVSILARHSRADDANLARKVAESAALQKARYQWLPGNIYGNHWEFPRAVPLRVRPLPAAGPGEREMG